MVEGLSRADIAFMVRHADLEALFAEGARALIEIMMENPGSLRPSVPLDIQCQEEEIDLLYHGWLSEIIFYKDAERLLLLPCTICITTLEKGFRLSARCRGEVVDRKRHRFRTDIKAVTLHGLTCNQEGGVWSATAVIDV